MSSRTNAIFTPCHRKHERGEEREERVEERMEREERAKREREWGERRESRERGLPRAKVCIIRARDCPECAILRESE